MLIALVQNLEMALCFTMRFMGGEENANREVGYEGNKAAEKAQNKKDKAPHARRGGVVSEHFANTEEPAMAALW